MQTQTQTHLQLVAKAVTGETLTLWERVELAVALRQLRQRLEAPRSRHRANQPTTPVTHRASTSTIAATLQAWGRAASSLQGAELE